MSTPFIGIFHIKPINTNGKKVYTSRHISQRSTFTMWIWLWSKEDVLFNSWYFLKRKNKWFYKILLSEYQQPN